MTERAVIDLGTTECSVCKEQYADSDDLPNRKPRVLDCGHHYCTGCLFRMQKVAGRTRSIDCPDCKERTRIKQSVDKLPLCRTILDVIQSSKIHGKMPSSASAMDVDADPAAASAGSGVAAAASSSSSSKREKPDTITCIDCEVNEAKWYCFRCKGGGEFCDACWSNKPVHHKADTSHRKQPISDRPQTHLSIQMCASHPGTPLDMFCKTDRTITCAKCHLAGAYKGHEVIDLKSQIDATASLLHTKQAHLEALEKSLAEKSKDIQGAIDLVISQAETRRVEVLAEQKRLESKLKEAVDDVCAKIKQQADLSRASLEQLQQQNASVISQLSARRSAIMCHLEDASIRDQPGVFFAAARHSITAAETPAVAALRIENSGHFTTLFGDWTSTEPPSPAAFRVQSSGDFTTLFSDSNCNDCAGVVDKAFRAVEIAIGSIEYSDCCFIHLAARVACEAALSNDANLQVDFARCFEEVGTLLRMRCDLPTAHADFAFLEPTTLTDQSVTAVLSSAESVLASACMEADRSSQEESRVCGALCAVLMCVAARESAAQEWMDKGGLSATARLLEDQRLLSRLKAELALATLTSPIERDSRFDSATVMDAGFSSICVSLLKRFHNSSRIRLSATTLLADLCCNADPDGLRRLIADGAVLSLVQFLQYPCDDHSMAKSLKDALRRIASLPEGRAALHHQDVRKAFNIAFQQPQNLTSLPSNREDSIAELFYLDSANTIGVPLTPEGTVLIEACLNYIRQGWRVESADQAAASAYTLAKLCTLTSYSDEACRLDAVTICLDAVRACQSLRADYWLQDGFDSILYALIAMAWKTTAAGKTARARFLQLGGLLLLMEVLGDGSADARPSFVVYKVCLMLLALAKAVDSVHGVRALSAASKNAIRQSLSVHAGAFNDVGWVRQKGSETLLRVLA